MLTDRYDLPLSTASSAARDAYVAGCETKLTMYPGAIEGLDRAIAADPGFALAHAARAHALLDRGDAAAARASMASANSLAAGLSAREASQPYRIFRLACGGRGGSGNFRIARPPERLAARCRRARHHRVHQRPDRQFRPRRAETRAAAPAGTPCAHLRL